MITMKKRNMMDIPCHDANGGKEYERHIMIRAKIVNVKDMPWQDVN